MKKTALLALILAFGLVAASCGTSDDTTTTAAAAQATTTTATPADTTTTTEDPMAAWPDTVTFGFIPSEQQETLAETVQRCVALLVITTS